MGFVEDTLAGPRPDAASASWWVCAGWGDDAGAVRIRSWWWHRPEWDRVAALGSWLAGL